MDWVDGPQRAVHLEAVHLRFHVETLRQHGLEDVSGGDVLLDPDDGVHVGLLAGPVLNFEMGLFSGNLWLGEPGQRLGQAFLQLVEPPDRLFVGIGGLAVGHIGRDNQPDLLAHMVEASTSSKNSRQASGTPSSSLANSGNRSIWRTAS